MACLKGLLSSSSSSSSSQETEHETEYNLAAMVENSKGVLKGDPSQFELLKVLGQGSFGKVSEPG